jgi:hypothetical protein
MHKEDKAALDSAARALGEAWRKARTGKRKDPKDKEDLRRRVEDFRTKGFTLGGRRRP